MPALFKLALGKGTTQPYLMVGPTIGLLLSSDLGAKAQGVSGSISIKDQTEFLDFGIALGAGVSFPAGSNTIFVEGRYALGLSDIYGDFSTLAGVEGVEDANLDAKTKGIQIMGGITFPLGGKK
jgi:hypothetical protein